MSSVAGRILFLAVCSRCFESVSKCICVTCYIEIGVHNEESRSVTSFKKLQFASKLVGNAFCLDWMQPVDC